MEVRGGNGSEVEKERGPDGRHLDKRDPDGKDLDKRDPDGRVHCVLLIE